MLLIISYIATGSILLLVCILAWLWIVDYHVHLRMTRKYSSERQKSSFKEIMALYDEILLYPSKTFPGSVFYLEFNQPYLHWDSYMHADIIILDGIGRMLDYVSYLRYMIWRICLERRVNKLNKKNVRFVRLV